MISTVLVRARGRVQWLEYSDSTDAVLCFVCRCLIHVTRCIFAFFFAACAFLARFLGPKFTQNAFSVGDPTGGAYSAPQTPSWWGWARCPLPRTPPPFSAVGLEFQPFGLQVSALRASGQTPLKTPWLRHCTQKQPTVACHTAQSKSPTTVSASSSSSWREAFSRSLPPLRSFARTVGPPLAAGPRSLLHPCRGRSGGSRWSTVGHRRVSTPVKAAHHPSTWCRFVGSGLLVHRVEIWRRAQRDPVFACEQCTRRRTGRYDAGLHR